MTTNTNWQSPAGFYLSNDSQLFEVIQCTGTKKGNKYFRWWKEDPEAEGWGTLMWNCIDTRGMRYFQTLDEILNLCGIDPIVLESI